MDITLFNAELANVSSVKSTFQSLELLELASLQVALLEQREKNPSTTATALIGLR